MNRRGLYGSKEGLFQLFAIGAGCRVAASFGQRADPVFNELKVSYFADQRQWIDRQPVCAGVFRIAVDAALHHDWNAARKCAVEDEYVRSGVLAEQSPA
ncbi:hypothetical protein G6F65_022386 [Rhizopus arrhizus]|nr:hypothetical protein G6F65_022386 [Rhizopus arrhizus]